MNARVGSKMDEQVVGQFGEDNNNISGELLIEYCTQPSEDSERNLSSTTLSPNKKPNLNGNIIELKEPYHNLVEAKLMCPFTPRRQKPTPNQNNNENATQELKYKLYLLQDPSIRGLDQNRFPKFLWDENRDSPMGLKPGIIFLETFSLASVHNLFRRVERYSVGMEALNFVILLHLFTSFLLMKSLQRPVVDAMGAIRCLGLNLLKSHLNLEPGHCSFDFLQFTVMGLNIEHIRLLFIESAVEVYRLYLVYGTARVIKFEGFHLRYYRLCSAFSTGTHRPRLMDLLFRYIYAQA
ncbi:hypothetical protein ILUMI_26415 [Ignelater luminosus]|uniref:Uncharacterized protein n=1 Tax=Ignelater luminosus TaxID=2038154 RepID=A0A8K0C4C5_IGNLU|nr:hypothetical protein ILUMI_26415 [Ignelater luminosus]